MRIGEVVVISHQACEPKDFIRSICRKIDIEQETINFARLEINDQLVVHLYGISIDKLNQSLSWDLFSRKMLGFIIIFDWENKPIFEATKPIIDHCSRYELPIIIIASIKNKHNPPIPNKFFQPEGIVLSPNSRFLFSQIDDPESARKAMVVLINMLLEKLS